MCIGCNTHLASYLFKKVLHCHGQLINCCCFLFLSMLAAGVSQQHEAFSLLESLFCLSVRLRSVSVSVCLSLSLTTCCLPSLLWTIQAFVNNDIKGRMYCNCELANGTSLKDISEAFVSILPKAFISVQCRCHFII